jgi:hypothetical protein
MSAVGSMMEADIPQGATEDSSGLFKSERSFIEKGLDQGRRR